MRPDWQIDSINFVYDISDLSGGYDINQMQTEEPTEIERFECPFCAELISVRAKKCRFCSEMIDPVLRRADEAVRTSERTSERPSNVYMNAAVATSHRHPFPHGAHILVSFLTLGLWLPIYLLLFLVRNREAYY